MSNRNANEVNSDGIVNEFFNPNGTMAFGTNVSEAISRYEFAHGQLDDPNAPIVFIRDQERPANVCGLACLDKLVATVNSAIRPL